MGSLQIVPFDKTNITALAAAFASVPDDEFSTGQRPSFGVLRIAGKTFAITRGGEKTIIKNDQGQPAQTIDVLVLRSTKGVSKTYFGGAKFDPKNPAPPVCYSNLGDKPAPDAKSPQAKTCATCANNVIGSAVNDFGNKTKACGDSKRLAVAAPTSLDEPLLLSLPPMSFRAYDAYVKWVLEHGMKVPMVLVRLSFDPEENYPKVQFAPVGVVPPDLAAAVMAARDSDVTLAIVGASQGADEHVAPTTETVPTPAPVVTPVVTLVPTPPPAAAPDKDPIIAGLEGIDAALDGLTFGD